LAESSQPGHEAPEPCRTSPSFRRPQQGGEDWCDDPRSCDGVRSRCCHHRVPQGVPQPKRNRCGSRQPTIDPLIISRRPMLTGRTQSDRESTPPRGWSESATTAEGPVQYEGPPTTASTGTIPLDCHPGIGTSPESPLPVSSSTVPSDRVARSPGAEEFFSSTQRDRPDHVCYPVDVIGLDVEQLPVAALFAICQHLEADIEFARERPSHAQPSHVGAA
jgi:hypothetical protein